MIMDILEAKDTGMVFVIPAVRVQNWICLVSRKIVALTSEMLTLVWNDIGR